MQAPLVASQSVAPQVRSVVEQAAVQQLPLPVAPHTPEVQAALLVQAPVAWTAVQVPLPLQ